MKVMILVCDENAYNGEIVERKFLLPARHEVLMFSGKYADQLLKYLRRKTATKTKRREKCEKS